MVSIALFRTNNEFFEIEGNTNEFDQPVLHVLSQVIYSPDYSNELIDWLVCLAFDIKMRVWVRTV